MKLLLETDATYQLVVKLMKQYIELAEYDTDVEGHLDGQRSKRLHEQLSILAREISSLLQEKTDEGETRPETKEGQYCYALDCIYHPLHETWKKEGKSIMETILDHNKETDYIWCKKEIHIGIACNAGCSDFKTE